MPIRIREILKQKIKNLMLPVIKRLSLNEIFPDMEIEFHTFYKECKLYTRTNIERMYSLYKAIEYIGKYEIPGDIVECGVWKGGSSMLVALYLATHNILTKNLYLYDTFEGMPRPTVKDVSIKGNPAADMWDYYTGKGMGWMEASLEEVQNNMGKTGYPSEKIHLIKGKVETTIPKIMPDQISLLRLDTDWYNSTYHELKYLYPRLSNQGVIIIDDYGYWKGAKEAVEQYFAETNTKILLNRIDYTGRIGIKVE